MKALIILLALYAAICAFGAVTGIQAIHNGHVVYYHGWQRILPVVFAPASGVLSYGLFKRRMWAWRICLWLGYLMVAQILIFNLIVPTIHESEAGMRMWIAISQLLFAAVVFYVVRKWWLPKKTLFAGANQALRS